MANQDNRNRSNEDNKKQQGGKESGRGFASMDEAKQREIASEGGRAAHEQGTAHEFTSEEAREAGRKGGEATAQNRERMSDTSRSEEGMRGGGRDNESGGNRSGGNGHGGSANQKSDSGRSSDESATGKSKSGKSGSSRSAGSEEE